MAHIAQQPLALRLLEQGLALRLQLLLAVFEHRIEQPGQIAEMILHRPGKLLVCGLADHPHRHPVNPALGEQAFGLEDQAFLGRPGHRLGGGLTGSGSGWRHRRNA